jgi:hypothetical protein
MLPHKENIDRRHYSRFKDSDDTCVLLRSPNNEELASLVDISREGALFEYIQTAKAFEEGSAVDIVFEDKKNCPEVISCRIVFDHQIDGEFYTPVKMRHVGVEFEDMAPRQLASLICFINRRLTHQLPKAIQIY